MKCWKLSNLVSLNKANDVNKFKIARKKWEEGEGRREGINNKKSVNTLKHLVIAIFLFGKKIVYKFLMKSSDLIISL